MTDLIGLCMCVEASVIVEGSEGPCGLSIACCMCVTERERQTKCRKGVRAEWDKSQGPSNAHKRSTDHPPCQLHCTRTTRATRAQISTSATKEEERRWSERGVLKPPPARPFHHSTGRKQASKQARSIGWMHGCMDVKTEREENKMCGDFDRSSVLAFALLSRFGPISSG